MALSSDIVAKFVKATNDTPEEKKESSVNGTIVDYNGKKYVRFDGSDLLTPVDTSTVVVDNKDRVIISVKNHLATITGNLTTPSASNKDMSAVIDQITEFEIVMAYRITTEELNSIKATIESLKVNTANIAELGAISAIIESLEAKYVDLDYVTAKDVEAINADIESLQVELGKFTDISTEDLEAINANIDQLKGYNAEFTYVSADRLAALKAEIRELDVNKLDAESAAIKFATIDFANINEAAIEKVFSDSGIIKDLVVDEGKITGELVGVTIKGDIIEGGTVKADKLVVKGSDGLFYKLNTDGVTTTAEQTEYNSLNGSVITAKSVTAEKISVSDLVAFDATIGGFVIGENSIHTDVKTDINSTIRGIYLDKDGQVAFGDDTNYLKYYLDETDNTWKLAISANNILLSTSNKNIEEVLEEQNLAIGDVNQQVTQTLSDVTTTVDDIQNTVSEAMDTLNAQQKSMEQNIQKITEFSQQADSFNFTFTQIDQIVTALDERLQAEVDEREQYIRFQDGKIYLGRKVDVGEDDFKLVIQNDRISFMQNANEMAYFSNDTLHVKDVEISNNLSFGNFIWYSRSNGNFAIKHV